MHPSPTQEACLYFLVEMKLVSVRNRTRFKAPDIFGRCRVMYFDSRYPQLRNIIPKYLR